MTIAIVHYHLGPGGVSQVIAAASRALTRSGIAHVILIGETPPNPADDLPFRMVPGLGYGPPPVGLTAEELVHRLRAGARDALEKAPDIWHFHNHSLGKNPLIAHAVARLAEDDERMVLQIHDLAEDGRPANYQVIADCRNLYPVSSRIHYVFLNARDRGVFRDAGLTGENSMVLGNPISLPEQTGRTGSGAPILFAPVRGIRRKNLGELVFLSALAPQGTSLAVSRAPSNPSARPMHDTWRKFARRQHLPIEFDVADHFSPAPGAGSDFETWAAHATHFITTSVSEGFGLPFLEAAAHGKPLIGRNLPHITAEHARHGIRCGNLYDQLLIPADWIDLAILRDHLHTTLERNFRHYRRKLSSRTSVATFDALIHDGWLDFGNLPEALQQGVIERMADLSTRSVPRVRIGGTSQCAEDWLRAAIDSRTPTATPDQLAPYSPALYQQKLVSLYSRLAEQAASPVRFLPPSAILTSHLAPGSFHFLLSALKPDSAPAFRHRAVIFDIYGTLLIAPAGGVKPDPAADPLLRSILERFGHKPPESPSTELHAAVLRHHATAGVPHPEIDLRVLWREILDLEPETDTAPLVRAIEAAWHPTRFMPGAEAMIRHLAASGLSLGLLSNAQCNTLSSLGGIADLFAPELTILSYQHGRAKPSPELFATLADRLAGRGIHPGEALFIGNDPVQDIAPAAAHGFKTALFIGHPDSIRPGACDHDFEIHRWSELTAL